jgi:Dolichyl-phosphate-mannose-protein mannosyltransferase
MTHDYFINTPKLDVMLTYKDSRLRYILLLVIPLSLSAFTHLWNPIGFPYFVGDEGHYIRRALYVLDQLDPQEGARYDHPYFGQLFLAGIFKIIGYPDSLNPTPGDVYSTQTLYMVPRIVMGILAVLDTFIIYKICERLYTRNRTIAFISSILFAVMPLTWLTRRIYLDSIQLPLILLSILFAVYYYKKGKTDYYNTKRSANKSSKFIDSKTLLIVLSGLTLGLAIFTKVPAIVMIPPIAYLIFRTDKNYGNKLKAIGLWIIPVILVPAMWPAYAISVGEYDNWYNGVFSQAGREGSGIGSFGLLFKIDPVLVSIGAIGFVYAIIMKKDLFLLLWIVPFLAFHTLVPWTQHFHWLQVLPAFCIAGGVLLDGVANILGKKLRVQTLEDYSSFETTSVTRVKGLLSTRLHNKYLKFRNMLTPTTILAIIVTAIVVFGLVSTTMLLTTSVNSSFIEMATYISNSLPNYKENYGDTEGRGESGGVCLWCTAPLNRYDEGEENNELGETDDVNMVTMIGNHWIFATFWIPKYVYDKDHIFKGFFTRNAVDTEKVLIVADSRLLDAISTENPEEHIRELQSLYGNTSVIANFRESRPDYDDNIYPYQSMSENRGIGNIQVRANYQ